MFSNSYQKDKDVSLFHILVPKKASKYQKTIAGIARSMIQKRLFANGKHNPSIPVALYTLHFKTIFPESIALAGFRLFSVIPCLAATLIHIIDKTLHV